MSRQGALPKLPLQYNGRPTFFSISNPHFQRAKNVCYVSTKTSGNAPRPVRMVNWLFLSCVCVCGVVIRCRYISEGA